MPVQPRHVSSRAAPRRRARWQPAALFVAIALLVASGSHTVEAGATVRDANLVSSREGPSATSTPTRRTSRMAGQVATARVPALARGAVAVEAPRKSAPISGSSVGVPPVATIEPLTVEAGNLTVRWRHGRASGFRLASQAVRIEVAAATPTGCGSFSAIGGVALGVGIDDRGTLSLGVPPSDGCLRVSVRLTDRGGRTSIAASAPYRIAPAAGATIAASEPPVERWAGKLNLFHASAFVTQKTFRWCVAASVQMMVNLVRNHTDRTMATQAKMIAYAQRWDNGPYGEDGGTDVTGWITALRHFGAGNYRAVGATTAAKALRVAATAMRQTGRPAGILVMEGRHAWVLHGFESRTDPRLDKWASVTAVRISGPLYPLQRTGGYDPRPNTRLSIGKLARYFEPSSVGALAGRYVVIIPTH